MTNSRYSIIAICIGIFVLSLLYAYQQGRARPLKEGIVWAVVWSDGDAQDGLYREKMPERPFEGQSGQYGVDMYGVLYPSCVEVRFDDGSGPRAKIIRLSQIKRLEFGSGGITIGK